MAEFWALLGMLLALLSVPGTFELLMLLSLIPMSEPTSPS